MIIKILSATLSLTLAGGLLFAQTPSAASGTSASRTNASSANERPTVQRQLTPSLVSAPGQGYPRPPQPSFCATPCLYYSGDFDPNGSNPQGLWSGNNATDWGDILHAFAPPGSGNYLITGASVNIATNETSGGVASIPYAIYTGVTTGNDGTVVCEGDATVTMSPYGVGYLGLSQYNYSIVINNSECQVTGGTTYWLDMEVQYNDSNGLLYELDVEDSSPPNAYGWPSMLDESYSYSTFFGEDDYVGTSADDGPCDGFGCDLFSFSISGSLTCPGSPLHRHHAANHADVRSASRSTNRSAKPQQSPFFCPAGSCLYYAGDNDTTNPNANGLFDFENPGIGISDAEVWVGVTPTASSTITGTSGNYYTSATAIGVNPTPFAVQTGITSGQGGQVVCTANGNAVVQAYGTGDFGLNSENYYVQQLSASCPVTEGVTYWVNFIPQYNDSGTIGYLEDDDGGHANAQGWPENVDCSYFNSASFGYAYEPAWGSSGACGGIGCDGFSISLTGTTTAKPYSPPGDGSKAPDKTKELAPR
jgi:hypothetical protein